MISRSSPDCQGGRGARARNRFAGPWRRGVDAERIARCSFCRKHDWEVGRLVAGGDGRAFLCDECEAMVHVVMTATPVPAPLGRPPVVPEPIRIDWQKLPHHQTHGPR
jgi:ClpX C4-type zinc finger